MLWHLWFACPRCRSLFASGGIIVAPADGFTDFLHGPSTVWRYARLAFAALRFAPGPQSAGGWMVVVLLVLVAAEGVGGSSPTTRSSALALVRIRFRCDQRPVLRVASRAGRWAKNDRLHMSRRCRVSVLRGENLVGPMFTRSQRGSWIHAGETTPRSRAWLAPADRCRARAAVALCHRGDGARALDDPVLGLPRCLGAILIVASLARVAQFTGPPHATSRGCLPWRTSASAAALLSMLCIKRRELHRSCPRSRASHVSVHRSPSRRG